jgi:nucleoside-diphosphate-sugar epimerase
MKKKTVLLTGATGFVGDICRKYWGDHFNLRLADIRPMAEAVDGSREPGKGVTTLAPHETFVNLDISNYEQFLAACQGVDVVVHLAASPGGPQPKYSSDTGKWGPAGSPSPGR